jgi:thiol-disulfide isomerase/thioredoxin
MNPEPTPEEALATREKPMLRRTVIGALGLAALGAGVTAAWLQMKKDAAQAVTGSAPDFWSLQWASPQGGELAMKTFAGRPLLINFWATWCPPCVEELPLINAFYQENKANGWQVLGLAVDKVAQVNAFIEKTPLAFPIGMAGFGGTELSRKLGNLTGALPFTIALDAKGNILLRKMGQVTAGELQLVAGLK